MVRESKVEPVPCVLDAESVTEKVPATVGVPEMSPVLVLSESPLGSPNAPKLVGELLAVI